MKLILVLLLSLAFLPTWGETDSDQAGEPTILPRNPDPEEAGNYPEGRTRPVFEQDFKLSRNDVVAFLGGTRVVTQGKNGYLETLLTRLARPEPIFVRNLGWEADTVYRRQRPLNFGTLTDQLRRIDATIVFMSFGQMEALDGPGRLPMFIEAYRALIEEVSKKTGQIVLITPHPFTRPASPHLPDLRQHNETIQEYAAAIRKIADSQGLLCVDLGQWSIEGRAFNGIHLDDAGHWQLAFEIISQLSESHPVSGDAVDNKGQFSDPKLEAMRQAAIRKNFLWQQNWRPTNWAFAYGDRQHVPSSHDHRPGKPRWMPAEINGVIDLIATEEALIARENQ